ncbi:MAG: hypothetical protein KAI47_26520, partial [Deltaproteobacteria bacterium]|nr:hypothetical protein [Deltaproteobacteria bacterium]
IGMSKALSTNTGHLRALEIAAALAQEKGLSQAETRYTTWAKALKQAIRDRLWLADVGLFSTFITTTLDPAPVHHVDLLGSAFAILYGIATPAQAKSVVAHYPHVPKGAPVLWPQQKDVAIYHNRAIWPFATAFWIRAARRVGNSAAVELGMSSLMRAAALNLSNMENIEMVTGKPWVDDPPYSGPVVNSQGQLWSIAAYLSMVQDIVFGIEATQEGLRFAPYITVNARHSLFGTSDRLVLNNFPYHGKTISVIVSLPKKSLGPHDGAYAVKQLRVNGQDAKPGQVVSASTFSLPRNLVEIDLGTAKDLGSAITLVTKTSDAQTLFAPRSPTIHTVALVGGKVTLAFDLGGEQATEVAINVYRDGQRVASALSGALTRWTDPTATSPNKSVCYALETTYLTSKNASQHSPPACYWGEQSARVTTIAASHFVAKGGSLNANHGRLHYEPWGDPGDTLVVPSFTPRFSGPHLFQVVAGNGGPIATGVTCAVKHLRVEETSTGKVAGEGYLVMPHLGTWDAWRDSNLLPIALDKTKTYRISIESTPEALNMSSFAHFATYTGGLGGAAGAFNRANIAELKILALIGQ